MLNTTTPVTAPAEPTFNAWNQPKNISELQTIKIPSFADITHKDATDLLGLAARILKDQFEDPSYGMVLEMASLVRNFRIHPGATTDFIRHAFDVVADLMWKRTGDK